MLRQCVTRGGTYDQGVLHPRWTGVREQMQAKQAAISGTGTKENDNSVGKVKKRGTFNTGTFNTERLARNKTHESDRGSHARDRYLCNQQHSTEAHATCYH
jgi:phage protein U